MIPILSRALALLKAAWPVLLAGYLAQLANGAVLFSAAWSIRRMLPGVGIDLESLLDPEGLLALLSNYLGAIGLAFIWLSLALTVSYLIFIFLTGGALGVFRSWALEGRAFTAEVFMRSGLGYLGPLIGLNLLLMGLTLAAVSVLSVFGITVGFVAGAAALGERTASGIGLLLVLTAVVALGLLLLGLFLFLASGMASARLVWDDLPVLTSLRYFIHGLKTRFWLHASLASALILLGALALLATLLIAVLGRLLVGHGPGASALIVLLQFAIYDFVSLYCLAAMTALMEKLRLQTAVGGAAA